jgi:hypothetical protein
MGFLDKAKSAAEQAKTAAEQAASRAREGVEDVQAKRALHTAYTELGEATFELIESGAIAHEGLSAAAAEVRAQKAKLDDDDDAAAPDTPDTPATPETPATTA